MNQISETAPYTKTANTENNHSDTLDMWVLSITLVLYCKGYTV